MCFFLPDHDRGLKVNVDNYEELMITWLEEEMLDVTEQDVCVDVRVRPSYAVCKNGGYPPIFCEPIGDW